MKLSEAIMLGSTTTKQAFRAYVTPDGRTCAMGSALHSIGTNLSQLELGPDTQICPLEKVRRICLSIWPWTVGMTDQPNCPACGLGEHDYLGGWGDYVGLIIHLNDGHEWTREQIAEYISTIEPKETVRDDRERNSISGDERTCGHQSGISEDRCLVS